jgi:hypothetical protein
MSTTKAITISAPQFKVLEVTIEGTSPYMQLRFSAKAMKQMMDKMEAGSTSRSKKTREARNFDEDFQQAMHISEDGWAGIPAMAFRNAAIDVCRMVGFKMTHAKMSIFIEAEGFDVIDGTPLVRILGSEPERTDLSVRNATGVADIRIRPMWRKWGAVLRVRYDEGQFTDEDVLNLLLRAGQQVGVGEGRPYSKNSNGLGFGLFVIKNAAKYEV